MIDAIDKTGGQPVCPGFIGGATIVTDDLRLVLALEAGRPFRYNVRSSK
ncbi:MAG: hypothetical protein ACRED1_13160 [Limisphaerales bacterium]